MIIGQVSVSYETLHAVYKYFSQKNTISALMVHAVYRYVFPKEPDNWKSSGSKTVFPPFSELEPHQYEAVHQSAGNFAFWL